MKSIKELREKAWREYDDPHELTDEQLRLVIEWRIFENHDRPKRHRDGSFGWHSLKEAERRPSMVPFLVSLKLQGLI